MTETSLVLFIDLKPDSRIDLRTAARAAIAWADMVEDVGTHFDPTSPPQIDLVGAEEGSQKIKAIISSLSEDPKANIRTAVVSSVVFLVGTTVTWTWEQVLEWITGPDAPHSVMELSDNERQMLAEEVAKALTDDLGKAPAKRVYDELGSDPDVTGVGVSGGMDRPRIVVPRDEFPPEVYVVEEEGFEKRVHVETVELVLFRPVLTEETNKRWGFTWPYGKIGATVKDQDFLKRLLSGQLGIPMAEGIVFTVELEITEERRDRVWEVKEYTVLRVLDITPPSKQADLDLE